MLLLKILLLFYYFATSNAQEQQLSTPKRELLTLQHQLKDQTGEVKIIIHYRENQKFLAHRTLSIIKEYFPKIHSYFKYVPKSQVHFVYEEVSRDANGSAQVFPYNIIRLQDYPPTGDTSLIASHDWLRTLIIHEYVHIVTLEMTNGWMDSLRTVFGSTMKLAALNPRWFLEGIATWAESFFTDEGRLYHPSILNVVVSLLKDPTFCPDLSCWDNPPKYPHGSTAYWVGAHFLNYVEKNKKDTLSCWADQNSRSFPFFVNKRFSHCYGEDIYASYEKFKNDFITQYDRFRCPFKNSNACENLKKLKTSPNDFKGVLENEYFAAVMINLGKKGSGSALRAEQLFLFDIKNSKATRIIFPKTVEQLYFAQDDGFLISFLYSGLIPGDRQFARFNTQTKKLNFLSDKICKVKNEKNVHVVAFVFPQNEQQNICIRYKLQQWDIGLEIAQEWHPLHNFREGEQIYRPVIFNDGQLKLKYNSNPVLANSGAELMGAFSNTAPITISLPSTTSLNTKEVIEAKIENEKEYSPLSYFYPNYLLLEYLSSGTVDSYGISTELADPRMRHQLYALLLYNDGVEENHAPFSGIAKYSYLPSYLPEINWVTQAFYSKLRFEFPQDLDNRQRIQEESGFLVRRDWLKTYWQFSLAAKLIRGDESDPYASRKLLKSSLIGSTDYLNNTPSSKLKTLSNSLELGLTDNKDNDQYPFLILSHREIWQWNEDWRSIFALQYGKMYFDRSGLVDGTFYGGGAPTVFSISFPFPSYLLGYGSLLGNEMVTGQIRQDWTFSYSFNGNGLIPFYLKSVGAIGGIEYLHADKLYYDFITENDPRLWVGFLGMKFASQLLYLLPVDIELVYAKSLDESRTRSNLSLMFQANITF